MKQTVIFLFLIFIGSTVFSQSKNKAENVILITIDGCRWKDVFEGADSALLFSPKFKKSDSKRLVPKFWAKTPDERRKRVMPFLWNTIATKGALYGNENYGNIVSVKNPYNISYVGYSEIFTGFVDTAINSNKLLKNPHENVLEFINKQPGFKGKVAAFASWDRAPYYFNAERSDMMVNGGYANITGPALTPLQQTLNNLQTLIHTSESSRPDYITYLQAKEYLRINRPRVMSIGFAWTDDRAHDGSYPMYLQEMFTFDAMIADLWSYLQSQPQYKDKTSIFITVDHGRGYGNEWVEHGPKVLHANEIWFAAMGPGIAPKGEVKTPGKIYQYQFAQSVAKLLGLKYDPIKGTGPAIEGLGN